MLQMRSLRYLAGEQLDVNRIAIQGAGMRPTAESDQVKICVGVRSTIKDIAKNSRSRCIVYWISE